MNAPRAGRTALVVVDLQPDFLPGGALPTAGGDEIVAPIAALLRARRHAVVVATQDWHPKGHVSFASSHEGRAPFDSIDLYGHEQTLWPDHCVPGTEGARLHPDVPWEYADLILRKGTDPRVDSYSGIRENWDERGRRPATGLAGYLKDRGVTAVEICGLARDYCVLWTAEDAADEGFDTTVRWELTRPVDPANDDAVRAALERKGVAIAIAG